MPQLDFSTYASQFFWLAVTFSFLYFMLARVVLPQIREVLQNRQSRISADLKKAEQLKLEAESAAADFTSALEEAKRKASELVQDARAQAEKEAEKHYAKLEAKLEAQAKDAEKRLAEIRAESNEQLLPVITDAVKEMCQSVANVNIDAKEAEKAASKLLKKAS
jgi:F-type H+-transporting ATPase subunit b